MSIKPVIFTDGTKFFDDLGKHYKQHKKGLFILAPSGAGKTHFCKAQTEPHWIDGDDLWTDAKAQPPVAEEYWNQGIDIINQVDQRSDVITAEAKLQGFWVMGASCYWLVPDAIVVPSKEQLTKNIAQRQANNYDGGATLEKLDQVWSHVEEIKKWEKRANVPHFETIQEAADFLTKK